MKKVSKKSIHPPLALEKGQLWRYPGIDIRVVHVGRYLVEHKIFKEGSATMRSRSVFSPILAFEESLNARKAQLVEPSPAVKAVSTTN